MSLNNLTKLNRLTVLLISELVFSESVDFVNCEVERCNR